LRGTVTDAGVARHDEVFRSIESSRPQNDRWAVFEDRAVAAFLG
jgi:hypothetical protein